MEPCFVLLFIQREGGKKRIIILLLVMPALILGVRFDLSSSPLAQVKC